MKQITTLAPLAGFKVDHIHHLAIEAEARRNKCEEKDFIKQCAALGITVTIQYESQLIGHYKATVKIFNGLDKWKKIMQDARIVTKKSNDFLNENILYASKKLSDDEYLTSVQDFENARNALVPEFKNNSQSKDGQEWAHRFSVLFEFNLAKQIPQPATVDLSKLPSTHKPAKIDTSYRGMLLNTGINKVSVTSGQGLDFRAPEFS